MRIECYVSQKEWYYIRQYKFRVREKLSLLNEVIYGPLSEEYIYDASEFPKHENEFYSCMTEKEIKQLESKEYFLTVTISNEPLEDCRRIVILGEIRPEDLLWEDKEGIITIREHNNILEVATV